MSNSIQLEEARADRLLQLHRQCALGAIPARFCSESARVWHIDLNILLLDQIRDGRLA